jgi:hypothetical protein
MVQVWWREITPTMGGKLINWVISALANIHIPHRQGWKVVGCIWKHYAYSTLRER